MKFRLPLLAALVFAPAPPALAADPAPVVAAERAFAADGLAMTWVEAFKKHVAPGGVMFAPEAVDAPAHLASLESKSRPTLFWWPLWAGMARSEDLGFTTGPFTVNGEPGGQYFTVWARQADGRWAWVFDGGPPVAVPPLAPPSSEPGVLAPGTPSPMALARVQAAEDRLAAAALQNAPAAYRAALAPDARIAGLSGRIAAGAAQTSEELARRPARVVFKRLGGGAARAGDLAWSYGDAVWDEGRGHYVRVWRHDRAGWQIVWDQLLPVKF